MEISGPGTYTLRNDILNNNAPVCINITSSNVIFEGSGYIIDGRDNANSIGVYVHNAPTPSTNVTIINVTVRDWNYGIYVWESEGCRIEDVTIESTRATTGQGLLLRSASGCIIINSTFRSNPYGINVTSSNDNTITGITANANTYGIYLASSHRNILTANNLSSNSNTGLYLLNSNDNTMIATTANSNTNNGCYISTSANNTLENTVANNNAYGIILSSSANTSLFTATVNRNTNTGLQILSSNLTVARDMTASWNSINGVLVTTSKSNSLAQTISLGNQYGVYLTGSSNNTIAETVASSNAHSGIYLTGSSNNILTGLTANSNTINGVYLTSSSRNTFNSATTMSNQYGFSLTGSNTTIITDATASSNTNMGIYLSTSDACTLTDNLANSNTNYGIRLVSLATNTLKNNTANNNLYGISLSLSNSNQIINSTVNNNINSGLYLDRSNNNILDRGISSSNTYAGVNLATATNNTILEIDSSRNTYGFYLSASPNNTLQKLDANGNTYGIYFSSTSNTFLSEITGQRNTNTALYLTSSHYNSLNNSNLSENTNYGIYLYSSRGTTITNNYLNNTNNLGFGGTVYSNTWNISKTAGTSIVNGPFLGGNFWGKPDWSGFSQINPDTDGDGICDSSYSLAAGGNIDYLPLHRPLPVANFTANVTLGQGPLTVSFNDTSSGAGIGLWYWEFGDGNFSIAQNPINNYEIPGTYDVRLRITNDGGLDWENRTAFIRVTNQTPVANFTTNVTLGQVPLTVSFNDTSSGAGIGQWYWEFGDGATSDVPNITHTYEAPGMYNVWLQVTNDGGLDWENRTAFIRVTNQTPVANFTTNVSSGQVPLTVRFNNTSTGQNLTSWFWDFGDGGVDNVPNPVHVYEIPGIFNVSLFVMNDGGGDWENRTALMTIFPRPEPTPQAYIRISGGRGSTGGIFTLYADHIDGGEEYTFDIGNYSSILSIGITPKETVREVFLYLERIPSLPESIPGPSFDVYGYFTVRLTGSPYCSLEHAYIDFSVQKVWLSEHGIAPNEIELVAYQRDFGWVSLPSTNLPEHEGQALYRATMRDLPSIFAIMRRAPPALAYDGNSLPFDVLSPSPLPNNGGETGFPIPLNYLYLTGYGAVMFLVGFFCKGCISGKNNSR